MMTVHSIDLDIKCTVTAISLPCSTAGLLGSWRDDPPGFTPGGFYSMQQIVKGSFRYERCCLGPGIVTESERGELAQIDVLPEHGLIVIFPLHFDVPNAAIIFIIEFHISALLVLQSAFELVIPLIETVIRPGEPEKFNFVAGLVDHSDIATVCGEGGGGS